MQKARFLNTKEIREIHSLLEEQYSFKGILDYAFVKNEKGRIYVISQDVSKVNIDRMRINSIGLYFAEENRGRLRLSIEGSQIVGPKAKKNTISLDTAQMKAWMSGEDLELHAEEEGFVILRHKGDYLGCGYAGVKGAILNYVPKTRRMSAVAD